VDGNGAAHEDAEQGLEIKRQQRPHVGEAEGAGGEEAQQD